MPLFELIQLGGGIGFILSVVLKVKTLAAESVWKIMSGFLLLMSWIPIYLYSTISFEIFNQINNGDYKSVHSQITKAEGILNWFVAIKVSLVVIFCVGTVSDA